MKPHLRIRRALEARASTGIMNLFEMSVADVKDLGYKQLKPKDAFEDGDLICATTKAQDLWIWVDDAAGLRKSLRAKEIGETIIVYRK